MMPVYSIHSMRTFISFSFSVFSTFLKFTTTLLKCKQIIMNLSVVLVLLCISAASGIKIGTFLDKLRKSLSDVGDIVDGAEDVVKYIRSFKVLRAAAEGDEKTIMKQIEDGYDVNHASLDGTTVLMEAAAHGQFKLIQLLLQQGAEIDRKNKYGFLASDYAMHGGHDEVLPLLTGYGEGESERLYSGSVGIKATQPVLLIALICGLRRIAKMIQD